MAIYLRGKKIAGGGKGASTSTPAFITYNTGDKTVVIQDDSVQVNSSTLFTYSEGDVNKVQSQMFIPISAGENITFSESNGKVSINSVPVNTYTAGSGIKISSEDVISWNNPTIMESSDVYGISKVYGGYAIKANTSFYFDDTGAKMLSEGIYSIPIEFGTGMSAVIDGNHISVSATGTPPTVQKFTRGA